MIAVLSATTNGDIRAALGLRAAIRVSGTALGASIVVADAMAAIAAGQRRQRFSAARPDGG